MNALHHKLSAHNAQTARFKAEQLVNSGIETPEQAVARLRVQRRTETSIRSRAVMAKIADAGGSLGEQIMAVTKEMTRIKAEYDALIAKHIPHVSWEGGTDDGYEAQVRGDYRVMQMGARHG